MRALIGRATDPTLQAALAQRNIGCLFVELLKIERITPPADFERRLSAAQALLLTSANAIDALAAATMRRDIPVLAVGEATADQARGAGFATVTSAAGDVAALAALATQRSDPQAGPLLYLRGEQVAGDLAAMLDGFAVDQAVLYRAVPTGHLPGEVGAALTQAALDLAVLFSPRSAANFVSLVKAAGLAENCRKIALVALSSAVARAADLPWAATHSAPHPSQASLLATIDQIGTR